MAQRRILVTALLLSGALVAACSGKPVAPEVRPVHVPQVGLQEPTGGAGAGAQAPAPGAQAPAAGAGTQVPVAEPAAPAQAPARGPAPAPADPAPAITYPAAPPVVADAAGFLEQIQQAKWDLKAVQALLPPAEGSYRNDSGEEPSYREHAYDGGALRLFEGQGKESLFAIVIDTGRPGYQAFRSLKAAPGVQLELFDRYVVIIRAAEGEVPAALQAKKVNLEALKPTLGSPTFAYHLHGVGTIMYFFVPEGVQLNGWEQEAEVVGKSGAELRRSVASMLAGDAAIFSRGPKVGRLSPDGKRWAGKLELGGYWNNWIVVRTAGQAEQRYQADYFIDDFIWLDDHRLMFLERNSGTFRFIDANTRSTKLVSLSAQVSRFGSAGGNKFWYEDDTGKVTEIAIP